MTEDMTTLFSACQLSRLAYRSTRQRCHRQVSPTRAEAFWSQWHIFVIRQGSSNVKVWE